MRSYQKGNLQQCVRNLFAQARYEFRVVHDIERKFGGVSGGEMIRSKVFSLWDNGADCFYGTALELISLGGDSEIMVDLSVYVKYSDYTCSCAVGLCKSPEDVFAWLKDPESLQKCLDRIDRLIADID